MTKCNCLPRGVFRIALTVWVLFGVGYLPSVDAQTVLTVASDATWDDATIVQGYDQIRVRGCTLTIAGGSYSGKLFITQIDGVINIQGQYADHTDDEQSPAAHYEDADLSLIVDNLVTGWDGTLFYRYSDGGVDFDLDVETFTNIGFTIPVGGGGPQEISIDIKPGADDNCINLGSYGVVPVAILSTESFDATDRTLIPPENVFLAGSGVRVRGKGNKYLASDEDVNGDGLLDLVVKIETENLDPDSFQDGGAFLTVCEQSDPESTVLYQGWDMITIVPPE